MNETSSVRTNSLSTKSALPPFHIRGLEQILFHRDAFAQTCVRPRSSFGLLQQRSYSSHIRPQTSYLQKSFPLALEASSNASSVENSPKEIIHNNKSRRTSISDRNIQILRAINDNQVYSLDSLRQQLEETSSALRERQLDLSYISESLILAKDEIAELRQQLRERDEFIRMKDELINEKDATLMEQASSLIKRDHELEEAIREGMDRERILNELKRERKAQINLTTQRTNTSRFREEACEVFPDTPQTLNSELDPMTDKKPLSTKGKFSLKEILREQREIRSRKAALKANLRASKAEEKELELESRRASEAQSGPSEAPRLSGTLSDGTSHPTNSDEGRTKSFVRLKSLVGGIRPRVHSSS